MEQEVKVTVLDLNSPKEVRQVKVDMDKIVDPESKLRIERMVEAMNAEDMPNDEFMKRATAMTPDEGELIMQQNPWVVEQVRKQAIARLLGTLLGAAGVPTPVPNRADPMRDFIAGCVETGHFTSSAAALDFTDQLEAFARAGYRDPVNNKPRKMPVVQ